MAGRQRLNNDAAATEAASDEQTQVAECQICAQIDDEGETSVLDTELFRGFVSEVYPWAVMLAVKRHECDGPWALTDAESAELGGLIRLVSRAVRATGSEWMYVLNFGDGIQLPHYHLGFFTRWDEIATAARQALYARVRDHPPQLFETAGRFAAEIRHQLMKPGDVQ